MIIIVLLLVFGSFVLTGLFWGGAHNWVRRRYDEPDDKRKRRDAY